MTKPYLANPAPIKQQNYPSDQGLADFSEWTQYFAIYAVIHRCFFIGHTLRASETLRSEN